MDEEVWTSKLRLWMEAQDILSLTTLLGEEVGFRLDFEDLMLSGCSNTFQNVRVNFKNHIYLNIYKYKTS